MKPFQRKSLAAVIKWISAAPFISVLILSVSALFYLNSFFWFALLLLSSVVLFLPARQELKRRFNFSFNPIAVVLALIIACLGTGTLYSRYVSNQENKLEAELSVINHDKLANDFPKLRPEILRRLHDDINESLFESVLADASRFSSVADAEFLSVLHDAEQRQKAVTEKQRTQRAKTDQKVFTAALKQSYLQALEVSDESIRLYDVNRQIVDKDTMVQTLRLLDQWSKTYSDRKQYEFDTNETKKVNAFKSNLVRLQQKAFPRLRQVYGRLAGKEMWESNIQAKAIGPGSRTLSFISFHFTDNHNIKLAEDTLGGPIAHLRFTHTRYQPFENVNGTQFAYSVPSDGQIAVWNGSQHEKAQ